MPLNENLTPEQLEVVRRLRADIYASGKSLRQIAREAFASPATVSQVMNGHRWPSPTMFRSIVRATTGREPDTAYKAAYEVVYTGSGRLIWNEKSGAWVGAPQTGTRRRRRLLAWVLAILILETGALIAGYNYYVEHPERCRDAIFCPSDSTAPSPVDEFYTRIRPAAQPWPVYRDRFEVFADTVVRAGTRVKVVCDVTAAPPPFAGERVRIQLPNGREGWVDSRAIETVGYRGGKCYLPPQEERQTVVPDGPSDGRGLGPLVWGHRVE
jgi:transcriptional regulator with XRE-family HTH domain